MIKSKTSPQFYGLIFSTFGFIHEAMVLCNIIFAKTILLTYSHAAPTIMRRMNSTTISANPPP